MHDTPYAADRATGTIYTNPILAKNLTPFEKKFWILHEKGHIILNTDDEIKADNFAFDSLAGTEYRSMKQMIEAEEKLLNPNSPYHQARIDNLYRRAIAWDKAHPSLNKATSAQITAMSRGYQDLLDTMGFYMNQQTQTTGTVTRDSNNSIYIMIVIIVMIIILSSLLKK